MTKQSTNKCLFIATLTFLACARVSIAEDLWPAKGAASAKVWEVFQDRVSANAHGLHEGIDIPADVQDPTGNPAANEVQLPAQMKLITKNNDSLEFETGADPNKIYIGFLHLTSIPPGLTVNTTYNAGTSLGYIADAYTSPVPDHLHLDVSTKSDAESADSICANAKNPLVYFAFANANKDPQNVRPQFVDRDNPTNPWDTDGDIFQFICDGNYLAAGGQDGR